MGDGETDYSSVQGLRDAEARAAWDALPGEERARIERGLMEATEYPVSVRTDARGVRHVVHESSHEPCCSKSKEVVGFSDDVAVSVDLDTELAVEPVFDEEAVSDFLSEQFGLSARQGCEVADWYLKAVRGAVMAEAGAMLGQVIGMFLLPGNLELKAHALAHAAHMAESNGLPSMRESARRCNVSQEGIRQAVKKWQSLLGLPEVKGAKSAEACEHYKAAALSKHWRNRKVGADSK